MEVVPDLEGLLQSLVPVGALRSISGDLSLRMLVVSLNVEAVLAVSQGQGWDLKQAVTPSEVPQPVVLVYYLASTLQILDLLDLPLDRLPVGLKLFLQAEVLLGEADVFFLEAGEGGGELAVLLFVEEADLREFLYSIDLEFLKDGPLFLLVLADFLVDQGIAGGKLVDRLHMIPILLLVLQYLPPQPVILLLNALYLLHYLLELH